MLAVSHVPVDCEELPVLVTVVAPVVVLELGTVVVATVWMIAPEYIERGICIPALRTSSLSTAFSASSARILSAYWSRIVFISVTMLSASDAVMFVAPTLTGMSDMRERSKSFFIQKYANNKLSITI